jgi:pyruvate dehydrogenase E2 component (dihydrolipoamide acetyltransferase)
MAQTTPTPSGGGRRAPATPLARAVAADLGVDLAAVTGSGRGGRVLRADVEALAAAAAPDGAAADGAAAAVDAPHVHLTVTVDAERLVEFRAELNRQLQARGHGLEVRLEDLVVKACAGLLRAEPDLNVPFAGDRLLRHRRVQVGIAVPAPGGTVVPVIRDADRKTLSQVAREAGELTGRARAGGLAAEELAGATFTVADLGALGVDQAMALIDPPQAAVLAVGAVRGEPAAVGDGAVAVRRRMRLTLSIDHRALDGATGAGFLRRLKEILEHPLEIVV